MKLTDPAYAKLQPGPQTYHYRYVIRVFDTKRGEKPAGPSFGERIIEETLPWRLLAEGEPMPPPERKPDPAVAAALPGAFRLMFLRDERDKTLVDVSIQADHPPVNMGFTMALRTGGETWPLGPVAWRRGSGARWDFPIDLPEQITTAEVVLQPDPQAVATLVTRGERPFNIMGIPSIWDGPELVLPGQPIRTQKISMVKLWPLKPEEALGHALEQMDPADAVTQQLQRTRDLAAARAALEPRHEGGALFALGCVLTAEEQYAAAMQRYLEARTLAPSPVQLRALQREQRRLCQLWLQQAEAGDAAAMSALGIAYEQGQGVGADVQEAKRWLRLAATAGNAEAMFRLAALYERMAGATVDTEQARQWFKDQTLEWYRKSANLGYEPAKQWINLHDH